MGCPQLRSGTGTGREAGKRGPPPAGLLRGKPALARHRPGRTGRGAQRNRRNPVVRIDGHLRRGTGAMPGAFRKCWRKWPGACCRPKKQISWPRFPHSWCASPAWKATSPFPGPAECRRNWGRVARRSLSASSRGASFLLALSLAADLLHLQEDGPGRIAIAAAERWSWPYPRVVGQTTVLGDGAGAVVVERGAAGAGCCARSPCARPSSRGTSIGTSCAVNHGRWTWKSCAD
ncbi:hypothetical protein GO496_02465 [Acidovorax citrulli]|nr:hypothetical protein [Paracidovorax citrulli]